MLIKARDEVKIPYGYGYCSYCRCFRYCSIIRQLCGWKYLVCDRCGGFRKWVRKERE